MYAANANKDMGSCLFENALETNCTQMNQFCEPCIICCKLKKCLKDNWIAWDDLLSTSLSSNFYRPIFYFQFSCRCSWSFLLAWRNKEGKATKNVDNGDGQSQVIAHALNVLIIFGLELRNLPTVSMLAKCQSLYSRALFATATFHSLTLFVNTSIVTATHIAITMCRPPTSL